MRTKLPYFFAGFILATLVLYWLLTRSIAFIPSWNKGLLIASIIICSGLFIAFLWSFYRSYYQPMKPVQWLSLFLLGILVAGLVFFGTAFARIDNKTTGMFSHYINSYSFGKVKFHIYRTSLLGTNVYVRYSRRGEIVSHRIDNIFFWNDPDSVKIEQKGNDYLIYTPKKKYLFSGEQRVAEELE